MNKLLLSTLAIGIIGATCEAAPRVKLPRLLQNPGVSKVQTTTVGKKKVRRAATENTGIWCPGTLNVSVWAGDGWFEVEDYARTYTQTGKIATETITSPLDPTELRTTYTYTENDMPVLELSEMSEEGDEFEKTEKVERTYDNRLTNVITQNRQYEWDLDEWYLSGNNYNRNITRDAAGNITQSEIAVWYDGDFDPTLRLNMTYGEDGKANTITENILTYDGFGFSWEEGQVFTSCVWEQTDGQIYQVDNLFEGNNRLKSCAINDVDFGGGALVYVTYGEDGSYTVSFTSMMNSGIEDYLTAAEAVFTPLDNYGSYTYEYTIHYLEDGEAMSETMRQTAKYDAYGNELLSEETYIFDGEEYVEGRLVGEVTYDETNGYPLTYTIASLDPETEEMIPEMRIAFSDYSLITAVKGICSDQIEDEAAPVEYYNLNGQRVLNPGHGIYLRRQGTKTTKVVL